MAGGPADEPDLILDVRRALAADHPLSLLAQVSQLLAVVDPRARDPFHRDQGDKVPSRDELVGSFLGADLVETSALLTVMAHLDGGDEVERARIRRELAARGHSLPPWLGDLEATTVYRTVEQVHVLGDGDNIFLGCRLGCGHELTGVVYVDHNLGTLVKDAFVVPGPIDEVLRFMQEKADDPDTGWDDIDPADARARVTEAIAKGAMTYPPFETDTWPACRPLVEWLVRRLPDGGGGYDFPEWDDEALAALASRFLASPFAADLDDPDHPQLLDSLLWFGSGYGPGDPLRWSPVAVEILLADWIPRKIVADADYLAKAPDVLRAFIRFCHDERGIRAELTAETLAAVDQWEPDYQHTIRSPRLQGPQALLAAAGLLDSDVPGDDGDLFQAELQDWRDVMLASLRDAVGGEEALDRLDDSPLPDEEFRWDGIPDDVHARVEEVLALCDGFAAALPDPEYRTAFRRLLARVASGDPDVFRRRARTETAAAAVCWIGGKANELFSPSGGGYLVKDLAAHFGLQQSGVSQRARSLLRAGGFSTEHYGGMELGSPDYLVSSHRRRIIERRDRYRSPDG